MSNRQQKLEYSAAEQNCPGCMGPCGMCDTIETFLTVNSMEISAPDRTALRKEAEASIKRDEPIRLKRCPAHLRDAFRRIIIEAAYKVRVRGKIFQSDKKEIWI